MLYCGILSSENDVINFLAFCMQTAGMAKNPHEVKGSITQLGKILNIQCSCKAGLSEKCKHCLAVLLYLGRTDSADLPLISCTDTKCLWKIPHMKVLDEYKPEPLYEHECYREKAKQEYSVTVSEDVREQIYNLLVNENTNSAFYKHKCGRHEPQKIPNNTNDLDLDVIESILSVESSTSMKKLSNLEPRQPEKSCCQEFLQSLAVECATTVCTKTLLNKFEWKNQRQYRITGSRCYNLYTYTKNKNADWKKKSMSYFFPKPFNMTKEMKHGVKNEQFARSAYENKNDITVYELGLVVSIINPWLAYSPDGVTLDENGNPDKLIEIKCPFMGKEKTVLDIRNTLDFLDKNDNLKTKHRYYGQIQLGMAILNLKQTDFIVYSSFDNEILVITVPFDETFTDQMLSSLKHAYYEEMLHYVCENQNNQK